MVRTARTVRHAAVLTWCLRPLKSPSRRWRWRSPSLARASRPHASSRGGTRRTRPPRPRRRRAVARARRARPAARPTPHAAPRPHAADRRRRRARPADRRSSSPSLWARRITLGTIFEPLLRYVPPARPAGPATTRRGSPSSWHVMPDGLEIRIELEPDVTFHDGAPLTTSDVQFTLDAVRDPRNGDRAPAADARRRRGDRADHLARGPAAAQAAERRGCCARSPRSRSCRCTSTTAACSARRRARRHRAVEAGVEQERRRPPDALRQVLGPGPPAIARPRVRLPARRRGRADRGQARRARHHPRADPGALARAGERARARRGVSRRSSSRRRACATSRSTPRARRSTTRASATRSRCSSIAARSRSACSTGSRGRRCGRSGRAVRSTAPRSPVPDFDPAAAGKLLDAAGWIDTRQGRHPRSSDGKQLQLVLIGAEHAAAEGSVGAAGEDRARLLRRGRAPRRRA